MTSSSSLPAGSRCARLFPLVLALACQPAVQASPGAQLKPAAAATPSKPTTPAASTSYDTGAAPSRDECPKQSWADSLRSVASSGVGSVLLGTLGLPLSEEAGRAPNKRLKGAPALVVEKGAAGYRLIGSDGTMGWASVSGPFVAAGVTFEDPNAELYSATPAVPPPDLKSAQSARISRRSSGHLGNESRKACGSWARVHGTTMSLRLGFK